MSVEHQPHKGDSSAVRARLAAVVADCQRRRSLGEAVSDEALMAANPELMPKLGEELRKLRIVAGARERAAQPSGTETKTHYAGNSDTGSGHLEVRCPSCHTPMEVAVDTQLTDLTCTACVSHFSLVDQSQATRMAPALSKLGRFELIERIGVGGFGSVWKARDKELDRTVAIKIPRAGDMTAEEQEKFFREARAAAQLRHPSIVSVHEVGRDGESVYIVSDFVRGVTLGDWLTGQQLTSREAAELCAKIADALHHAHEQGVVHRDLKPANIMIDGDGQPHLMDFGLARREVGEVTVTLDGQVLGTPAYMSPEQAQGEAHSADRRSDVYSLGVILFQLLTGELPFRGNARMLMHQVIHDEPPSPRKLNGNVPKDLETITLKCLEKESTKRYPTAQELADDLHRFQAKRPVQARPISRLSRGWRWCRRNAMVASLSAILLLVLFTIAVMSPIVALKQSALRQQAEADKKLANVAAAKSAQVAQFLKDMLSSVGPSMALGRDTTMLREILDKTAQRIGSDLKDQPDVEAELRATIGNVYMELGAYSEAEAMLRQAVTIQKAHRETDDAVVARSLSDLAFLLRLEGKLDEAEANYREALLKKEKLLGNNHPSSAGTLADFSVVLARQGKPEEAEVMLRKSLAVEEEHLGLEHPDVAKTLNKLSLVLLDQGKLAEAEDAGKQSLALRKSIYGDNHPAVAYSLNDLALVFGAEGKLEEADSMFRESRAMLLKLFGNEHPFVASSVNNNLNILLRQRKFSDAEQLFREVIVPSVKGKPASASLLAARANYYARTGRWIEASADLAEALSIDSEEAEYWYRLAPLLVDTKGIGSFNKHRREMLTKFGDTTDPTTARHVLKVCLLTPMPDVDSKLTEKMMTCLTKVEEGAELIKAWLGYRQGQFLDAAQRSQKAPDPTAPPSIDADRFLLLAMAYSHLDNVKEARLALGRGKAIVDEAISGLDKGDLGEDWNNWLAARIHLREAQQLIDGETVTKPESNE